LEANLPFGIFLNLTLQEISIIKRSKWGTNNKTNPNYESLWWVMHM
jgi:hypothetical protein